MILLFCGNFLGFNSQLLNCSMDQPSDSRNLSLGSVWDSYLQLLNLNEGILWIHHLSFILICVLHLEKNLNSKIVFVFHEFHIWVSKSAFFADQIDNYHLLEVINFCELLCSVCGFLTFLAGLFPHKDFPLLVLNEFGGLFLLHSKFISLRKDRNLL